MNLLEKILAEYTPNPMTDTEEQYRLKSVIASLPYNDRVIITLYSDMKSMPKVARLLHVSVSTIYININRIRWDITRRLNKLNNSK